MRNATVIAIALCMLSSAAVLASESSHLEKRWGDLCDKTGFLGLTAFPANASYPAGSTAPLSWTKALDDSWDSLHVNVWIRNLDLVESVDNAATDGTIADPMPNSQTSVQWPIPANFTVGSNYQIRIKADKKDRTQSVTTCSALFSVTAPKASAAADKLAGGVVAAIAVLAAAMM
ncbi:hypothetical protein RI367_008386 [Sorochytrium milnesiophthora]